MGKPGSIEGKVRAFRNPILERLSRSHPLVPLLVWGPVALGSFFLGIRTGAAPLRAAGLAGAGLAAWTLFEYALHRWIFHWQPRNPRMREWFRPVHQLHHDVQEWDRIVAPPLMSVPVALVVFATLRLALGAPAAYPFFGGFVVGYLVYDYIHFFTHFVRPHTRIGKGLRKRHLQHHFACPDRWFGVSSPLWDYVFRTHVPRGARPAARSG